MMSHSFCHPTTRRKKGTLRPSSRSTGSITRNCVAQQWLMWHSSHQRVWWEGRTNFSWNKSGVKSLMKPALWWMTNQISTIQCVWVRRSDPCSTVSWRRALRRNSAGKSTRMWIGATRSSRCSSCAARMVDSRSIMTKSRCREIKNSQTLWVKET